MEKMMKKTYFEELIEAVEKQGLKNTTLTPLEIAEKFFSEQHDVAIRLERFHAVVKERGLGFWRECGYMEEDFDVLFEHIERGYSLRITSFSPLMRIFDKIREMGDVNSFRMELTDKETCPECDGEGYSYDHERCKECNGAGRIIETNVFEGKGEEEYQFAMNVHNPYYRELDKDKLFTSYSGYLERIEEDIDVEKGLERWEVEKRVKPFCKLIGEDGNVFNLLGIVSKTLKRAGYKKEAEEVSKRAWECESYDKALQLFMDYVDVY